MEPFFCNTKIPCALTHSPKDAPRVNKRKVDKLDNEAIDRPNNHKDYMFYIKKTIKEEKEKEKEKEKRELEKAKREIENEKAKRDIIAIASLIDSLVVDVIKNP